MNRVGTPRAQGVSDDGATAATGEDVLLRLALWLADVSAEAALGTTQPEGATIPDSAPLHATDGTRESLRGEPST